MKTIQIHAVDNVAVALQPVAKGEQIEAGERIVEVRGGDPPGP